MVCHVLRGGLQYRCVQVESGRLSLAIVKASGVAVGGVQMRDRRLYHYESPCSSSRFRRVNLLSSSVLSTNCSFVHKPQQTRTIIISKVIDAFRGSDLTNIQGLSKFILESRPVSGIAGVYEWTEAATGLPWAANILVCSCLLQIIFNVPATIYLTKWLTGKEKHTADMIATKSTVMRSPSRENIAMFTTMNNDLLRQYGCQNYKFFLTLLYQFVYVTISSFGVRSLLLNSNLDAQSGLLPWGTCLSSPDLMFILPVANVAVSLLLIEITAWKKLGSEDGLKMTLKRASTPYKAEPLYLLNLRRFCSLPLILIYAMVPSALTVHWFTMAAVAANTQILMSHRQTRRMLGIPSCYYETDSPYKDFLQHLRKNVKVLGKTS